MNGPSGSEQSSTKPFGSEPFGSEPFGNGGLPPQLRHLGQFLPWFSLGYYWLLAIILLTAALAKSLWLDPEARTGPFQIAWLLAAIVAIEVLAAGGLLFLARHRPVQVRRAAIALFTTLAAFALHAAIRGEPCQCFGTDAIPSAATLLLDLMAVGLLVMLPLPQPGQRWSWTTTAALAVTGLLAIGLATHTYLSAPTPLPDSGALPPGAHTVALHPERWIGQRLPIEEHLDIEGDLNDGSWLLVLYRPDCAHCLRIVPSLRDQFLATTVPNSTRRLALVDLSAGQAAGALQGTSGPHIVFGRMQPGRRWIATPPIGLLLEGGVVTRLLTPSQLESWTLDSPGRSE